MQTNRFAIVDIEIANTMTHENWDNRKADICLIGALLVEDNTIQSIVQIPRFAGMSKEDYAPIIRKLLDSLVNANYVLWAFNATFEQEAIDAYCLQRYEFNEIRGGLKGSNTSKDKLYNILADKFQTGLIYDVFDGDAKHCAESYAQYLMGSNYWHLQSIISHNLNCLLKEHIILNHQAWLLEHAIVDKGGFVDGWKKEI